MKRIISILLAIATLLTLTACGKKDSEKVQTSSKGETTTQSPAKKETKSEKVGPIEDYLVKVELTPENFNDYFEWECMHDLNDWGDITGGFYITLKSKAYDDGLIIYECPDDVKFEKKELTSEGDFGTDELSRYFGVNSDSYGTHLWNESLDDGFNKEEKTCTYGDIHPISCYELGRVKGTITFVKAEYIDHIEEYEFCTSGGHKEYYANIYLKNGESLSHLYREGMMF